jgi:hypothetical protein
MMMIAKNGPDFKSEFDEVFELVSENWSGQTKPSEDQRLIAGIYFMIHKYTQS